MAATHYGWRPCASTRPGTCRHEWPRTTCSTGTSRVMPPTCSAPSPGHCATE